MVESNESLLELFWGIAVQPCEQKGEDGREVLLDNSASGVSMSGQWLR